MTVLAQALRANTDAVYACAPDALWEPDGHSVLFRAGTSLGQAGLVTTAAGHYRDHPCSAVADRSPSTYCHSMR